MNFSRHKKIADKHWRLTNLYKIVNKKGEKQTFTPNKIQNIINQSTAQRKMILKARQFGVSTNEILKLFDETIFYRNKTNVVIADKQDNVEKLFRIVRRAYEFLPDELKPVLDRGDGSKYAMYFPDLNSRIYADIELRGDTVQNLHVSEAAFTKDSSRLKSTLQAVPIDGKVTIETTANGMNNHFFDMWTDPDSPFEKLFFPWFIHDEYRISNRERISYTDEEIAFCQKAKKMFNVEIFEEQIKFRRLKKAELKASSSDLTVVSFEQEYPEDDRTCFLSTGRAIFSQEDLAKHQPKTPIEDRGYLKIYERIDKNESYICSADTAEGIGGDFSAAVMIATKSKKIVAKLRGHFKPYEFAHKLLEICDLYTARNVKPLLVVERNNHGHAVLLELTEHARYPNMYTHTDNRLGFKTDNVTRPMVISTFINAIENQHVVVNDKEVLLECATLVNNNGKVEAATGKHDDCVIASSIGLFVLTHNFNQDLYKEITKKILME